MKKCLKIIFTSQETENFLHDFVQNNARKLEVEGTVQIVEPNQVIVIACGSKEKVDDFLDILCEGYDSFVPEDVQVEPFLKEKDYRGIFRILE